MSECPNRGWGTEGGQSLLAEIASCQMEFKYLAHLTKRVEYFLKPDRVIELMERDPHPDGLWATSWNLQTGTQVPGELVILTFIVYCYTDESLSGHISIGGLADSAVRTISQNKMEIEGRSLMSFLF